MLGKLAELILFGFAPMMLGAIFMPGAVAAEEITLTGEVAYRERIALPPNAVLTVRLTDKEARLMALFCRHRGETLARSDILEEVWGMDAFPTERTVDNVIVRLRRYFEPDPENPAHIVSVRGLGYRFNG